MCNCATHRIARIAQTHDYSVCGLAGHIVKCGALGRAELWASQNHSGSRLTCSDNRAREYLRFVQFVQSRRTARTPDCTNCTNARLRLYRVAGSLWIVGFWVGLCCGHHSIILAAVSLIPTTGNADTCDLCNLCDRAEQPMSGVSRTMHTASWCRWVCCENAALIPTQQPHPAPHPAP